MKAFFPRIALLVSCLIGHAMAAEDAEAEPKSHLRDVINARIAEEAKKKGPETPAKPQPASAPAPATPEANANPAAVTNLPAPATPPPKEPAPASSATPTAKTVQEPATMLPKVEVKKDRITVLDHQLQEQEKEIAREKKNTQPTELDKALNDSKVSTALSLFGGQSNQYRANVAKERVSLMEEEKDLLEEIAHAKTKAEKQELQKQLDEIKAMRRELEKNLR